MINLLVTELAISYAVFIFKIEISIKLVIEIVIDYSVFESVNQ